MNIFILTLPVYLSEVAQLLNAIDLASYVLFVMMLAIIMVSAAVTCRLILHERTRETGTMRALGFYEADVRTVLRLEIISMAFVAIIVGFAAGLLLNNVLSYSSFSWFPGFEVFMQNGRLAARYLPGTIIVNIVITGCAIALAIGVPIFRNSRSPLPEMLSGGAV
jgi:ABC-type antimicrobial peptide transport system permease subunit